MFRLGWPAVPCLIALCAASGTALAFGPEGHGAIADIAEAHLQPKQQEAVARLLQSEGSRHLDDISSWADAVRSSRPNTASWHFVDIPLPEDRYKATRDCVNGKCIVEALQRQVEILADTSKPEPERLEALKWVVHLTGDIHQPLHCTDNDDTGGNDVHLTYEGEKTNFHRIWDSAIIEDNYGWELGENFSFDHKAVRDEALKIDAAKTDSERAEMAPPGLLDDFAKVTVAWAEESHRLGQEAYADIPERRKKGWDDDYQAKYLPLVQQQIELAGVRLAEILNEALQ